MKIAAGASNGLQYFHVESNFHTIHMDLKSENIFRDDNFHQKLSNFGLAKVGLSVMSLTSTHVSWRLPVIVIPSMPRLELIFFYMIFTALELCFLNLSSDARLSTIQGLFENAILYHV
ncbi:Proline-rich receptor-like protein kinase PERK15 [Linum perenne]